MSAANPWAELESSDDDFWDEDGPFGRGRRYDDDDGVAANGRKKLRVCKRGSVERIPQAPGLRACVEGRSARRYVIFIFSRSPRRARAENHNLMFRSTERELMANAVRLAASALPSIRESHLHARRARSRPLRVFGRAHHVDMSRVHRRAGIAEHRRRTAEQVRIEQTRSSSRGGAVVRPVSEPPASALQPHPAYVCSAARVCTRRCRRCLWLALLLGGGLARSRGYKC